MALNLNRPFSCFFNASFLHIALLLFLMSISNVKFPEAGIVLRYWQRKFHVPDLGLILQFSHYPLMSISNVKFPEAGIVLRYWQRKFHVPDFRSLCLAPVLPCSCGVEKGVFCSW